MGNWTTVSSAASAAPPQLPASIGLSEVGSRVIVAPLNRTQATLQVAWTAPGSGPAPTTAHYSLNVPAGVEGAAGDAPVQTSGSTRYIQFPAWAPTANQSWSVTISLETATAASAAITSPAVTIYAIGAAAANNVSNLAVGTLQYVSDADGHWFFGFQVSANNAGVDPNFFTSKITACWGSITGGVFTPAADQPSPVYLMNGLEFQTPTYSIFWGGFPVFSAADHTTLRVQAWSQSRSQAAASPMTFTAQSTAVGGTTDHVDVVPTVQVGRIPATRLDGSTFGVGIARNATTGKPDVQITTGLAVNGSNQIAVAITTGLKFLSNQLSVDAGAGLTSSGNSVVLKLGAGMGFDVYNNAQVAIGLGLTMSSNQVVPNLGAGLNLSGSLIEINAGNGVTTSGGSLQANLTTGLKLSGAAITVDISVGLTTSGNQITVNAGAGLGTSGMQVIVPANGISSSMIASLDVSKLNAGTLTVGSGGLTFSGTGGIVVANGGNISASPGSVLGTTFKTNYGLGGSPEYTIYNAASPYYTTVIDAVGNALFATLKVGGVSCIDASQIGYFSQIYAGGLQVVDGSQNGSFATVSASVGFKAPNGATGLTGNYQVATPGGGSMVLSYSGGILTGQW